MFEPYFHNKTISKHIALFGTLFNNLHVVRRDGSANILNQEKVPIAYSPRRKFLARLDEREDLDDAVASIKLPRMGYELTSAQYDSERQNNRLCNVTVTSTDGDTNKKALLYNGAPYILNFELNIVAKIQNDANQILEQILPTFTPSYNVKIRPIDGQPTILSDVKFILTGVNMQNDYEGEFAERQIIIYTLTFDVKTVFFGGLSDSEVIKTAIVDFHDFDNPDDLIVRKTHAVTPQSATEDDTFTITVTETFGFDD